MYVVYRHTFGYVWKDEGQMEPYRPDLPPQKGSKEISSEYSLEGLMLKLKLILWPPDA